MDVSDANETSVPACNCFIRFKVSLMIQDVEGCLLQLKKMTQCHDFKFDMLKVIGMLSIIKKCDGCHLP